MIVDRASLCSAPERTGSKKETMRAIRCVAVIAGVMFIGGYDCIYSVDV